MSLVFAYNYGYPFVCVWGGGGGRGARGESLSGKYGCAGRALGVLGVNFCPGIRFLAIFVTFHKRVNNKWLTY